MATITTINDNDNISAGNEVINTNFTNLNNDKIETSYLDTDTTLAANSDVKIPTQKAVKTYVDTGGNVNASESAKGIVEEATDAEVAAGTATGGTGAKLFVTPAKLDTHLDNLFAVGVPYKAVILSTIFETSARFTAILNSGTNTFDTTGLAMTTTSTTTRAAGVTWTLASDAGAGQGNIFLGSPVFTSSMQVTTGTTGSAYIGLGLVTKDGTGHTYTTDHCGFKILISASVASLYATQGDGSSETASSALTTIASDDNLDVLLKMNGSTSVDYYWRKNGGSWSSATNLTGNMPNTSSYQAQFSVSNNSTATTQSIRVFSASYSR